jgi:hypothetical protein
MPEPTVNERIAQIDETLKKGIALQTSYGQSEVGVAALKEAAELLAQAADMHAQLAREPHLADAYRKISDIHASYYQSRSHNAMWNYYYEERDVDNALEQQAERLKSLQKALEQADHEVEIGGPVADALGMAPAVWRHELIECEALKIATLARGAWDAGRHIEALDHYRAVERNHLAAYQDTVAQDLGQERERIAKGNHASAIAMARKAMATLAFHRVADDDGVARLTPDQATDFLSHAFEAYKGDLSAYEANPAWTQYQHGAKVSKEAIENYLKQNGQQAWLEAYCSFEDEPLFLNIMKLLDLDRFTEIEHLRHVKGDEWPRWLTSFAFACLAAILICICLAIFRSAWTLTAIPAICVIYLLVSASTLRWGGHLTEASYIQCVKLAMKGLTRHPTRE